MANPPRKFNFLFTRHGQAAHNLPTNYTYRDTAKAVESAIPETLTAGQKTDLRTITDKITLKQLDTNKNPIYSDPSLTFEGATQAIGAMKAIKEELKIKKIDPKSIRIFSSPLQRAILTGMALQKASESTHPTYYNVSFSERLSLGKYDHLDTTKLGSYTSAGIGSMVSKTILPVDKTVEESKDALKKRMFVGFEEVLETLEKEKKPDGVDIEAVAIATHKGAIREFMTILLVKAEHGKINFKMTKEDGTVANYNELTEEEKKFLKGNPDNAQTYSLLVERDLEGKLSIIFEKKINASKNLLQTDIDKVLEKPNQEGLCLLSSEIHDSLTKDIEGFGSFYSLVMDKIKSSNELEKFLKEEVKVPEEKIPNALYQIKKQAFSVPSTSQSFGSEVAITPRTISSPLPIPNSTSQLSFLSSPTESGPGGSPLGDHPSMTSPSRTLNFGTRNVPPFLGTSKLNTLASTNSTTTLGEITPRTPLTSPTILHTSSSVIPSSSRTPSPSR